MTLIPRAFRIKASFPESRRPEFKARCDAFVQAVVVLFADGSTATNADMPRHVTSQDVEGWWDQRLPGPAAG